MSLLHRILSAGSSAAAPLYSDDVFSAYTYTGNGSTQTITNGIDLAGKGGMVWIKSRSNAYDNALFDTLRGGAGRLVSNSTNAQNNSADYITAFNAGGFTTGSGGVSVNWSGENYASWTFRKAPKFFDVVTYTGTGANRTIAHALGSVPGMIIVKRIDATADWQVYSNSIANTEYLVLNSTAAKATGTTRWNSTTPTSSVFSLGTDTTVNASGGTYVAYLFAHDTSATGLIQCGSFTTDGGGYATVNLGWEPQFLLLKKSNDPSAWFMYDTARGLVVDTGVAKYLQPNSSGSELSNAGVHNPTITSTGFTTNPGTAAAETSIYLAIRRPNKPPTLGTQVYNAIAATMSNGTKRTVGFQVDLQIKKRYSAGGPSYWLDRLRGVNTTPNIVSTPHLDTSGTAAEATNTGMTTGWDSTGFLDPTIDNGDTVVLHNFKRAVGVFDEVCYTGNGIWQTLAHNLAAVPELMIVKARATNDVIFVNWYVYSSPLGNSQTLLLNSINTPSGGTGYWNSTTPTSTTFTVGSYLSYNAIGFATYVAYLFATKAGISKCGSYTGNGTSQTIDCGFTTGARFVMIKRYDTTGDWYVWDSARGIVAGNDPHLSLNTTAAEVTTDDSVDTATSGFIVNQVAASNINVSAGTYIFLAIA